MIGFRQRIEETILPGPGMDLYRWQANDRGPLVSSDGQLTVLGIISAVKLQAEVSLRRTRDIGIKGLGISVHFL